MTSAGRLWASNYLSVQQVGGSTESLLISRLLFMYSHTWGKDHLFWGPVFLVHTSELPPPTNNDHRFDCTWIMSLKLVLIFKLIKMAEFNWLIFFRLGARDSVYYTSLRRHAFFRGIDFERLPEMTPPSLGMLPVVPEGPDPCWKRCPDAKPGADRIPLLVGRVFICLSQTIFCNTIPMAVFTISSTLSRLLIDCCMKSLATIYH